MEQLKLPHRLVLLDQYRDGMSDQISPERMQSMVALGMLVETLQMGKTQIRDNELILADETLTQYTILDWVIRVIGRSEAFKPLKEWPQELGLQMPIYKHVRDNLLENKILVENKKKIAGLLLRKKYKVNDPNVIEGLMEHLKNSSNSENMNLRDLASIILLMNTELKSLADFEVDVQDLAKKVSAQDNTKAAVAETALSI